MRLYDKLSQRKKNGQTLDMKKIGLDTLYQLWWKEQCTDEMIADLYGVSKKKVTNLRHSWSIKLPETIVQEFDKRFTGTLSDEPSVEATSHDAETLIERIHDLNDLELETLRLELASRFAVFAHVKQEVEFLRLVEQAVREFETDMNGEAEH